MTDKIDPVCGMKIREDLAPAGMTYKGLPFYFCSLSCKSEFEANPRAYIEKRGPAPKQSEGAAA